MHKDELNGDVEFTVLLPNFLGDTLGPFANASRRFGVERFPGRDALQDQIKVGQDLRVGASGVGFGGGPKIRRRQVANLFPSCMSLIARELIHETKKIARQNLLSA